MKSSKVQGVQLINPGYGYTSIPSIVFNGGGGAGAAATVAIGDGVVGIVTLTNQGSGYSTVPTVAFSGAPGSGVTATGIAHLNSVGIVTQIGITNAGLGYTVAPTVTISSPYMENSGDYVFNEEVIGSISGAKARVKSWNSTTNALEVSIATGEFTNGELVTGQESGAKHQYRKVSEEFSKDTFAENNEIETAADSIIDFSQTNPFGMP